MEKLTLEIDGMSCGHCVGAVRRALEGIDGVQVESVRVGEASVQYDPRAVTTDVIAAAIADEGYQPRGA
ncbi:MAG TPA: cation transporter [Longimicrobium sp.]